MPARLFLAVVLTAIVGLGVALPAAAHATPPSSVLAVEGGQQGGGGEQPAGGEQAPAEEQHQAPGPEPAPPDAEDNPAAPEPYETPWTWGLGVLLLGTALLLTLIVAGLYYLLVHRPRQRSAERA